MKIPVEDISPAGLEIQFDESKNVLTEALSGVSLPPDVIIDPKIRGHVAITKDNEEILISGAVEVNMTMKCSRCLCQFESSIPINLLLTARRQVGQDSEYETDSELDFNEVLIHNEEIDLGELIVQEIFLDIPMKPLCKDDCPGLCSQCGGAIGPDGCSCSPGDSVDPRWEKLVILKSRLNN
jgi:uncharacterized protein